MSPAFKSFSAALAGIRQRPVCVILGGGQWALQYARALQWFVANGKASAVIIYKSDYGLGSPEYLSYLHNTITNMVQAEKWGAICIDQNNLDDAEVCELPKLLRPVAVFVVTPPEVHCDNAREWAPHAEYVFVEKPFATSASEVRSLREQLSATKSLNVFGYDHYAARLQEALETKSLRSLKLKDGDSFLFEMFESAPHGLVERGPSLSRIGMMFDMASHAVPLLQWISGDLDAVIKAPTELCASTLWNRAREAPYIQGETFARLKFPVPCRQDIASAILDATIQVGKGVGAADSKLVRISAKSRAARARTLTLDQSVMLASRDDVIVQPIHERVIHRLVQDALKGDSVRNSPGVLRLDQAEQIVEVLALWHGHLTDHTIRNGNRLQHYMQGMSADEICDENGLHRTCISWAHR